MPGTLEAGMREAGMIEAGMLEAGTLEAGMLRAMPPMPLMPLMPLMRATGRPPAMRDADAACRENGFCVRGSGCAHMGVGDEAAGPSD